MLRKLLTTAAISVAISIPLLEVAIRSVMPRQLVRPCDRPDVDLGFVLAPHCEYFDDWGVPMYAFHVRTNNLGARMDRDVDERAPERRVLLLGDSFTFGWGVEREASFAGIVSDRVAAEVPDARLINLGVGAYSTGHHRKQVERALPRLKPSGVVLFLNSNDFFDNVDRGVDYRTFRWEREGDGVVLVREQVFSPVKRFLLMHTPYRWLDQHSHVWVAMKDARRRLAGVGPPPFEYESAAGVELELIPKVTTAHLRELASLLQREGVPLLVAWIPARCDLGFANARPCPLPIERWAEQLPDELAAVGAVPFIDPLPQLSAHTAGRWRADYYFADGHFTERGNRLYADATGSRIREFVAGLPQRAR